MVGLGGGADNDGSLEDLIPDKDPEPQPPGVANRHSALNKKLGLAPAGRKIKQPWTDEEVEALREGVAKHGKGAWKAVLVETLARVPGQDHDGSQGQVAQLGEKGGEGEGPRGSGGNRQRRGGGSGFLVS